MTRLRTVTAAMAILAWLVAGYTPAAAELKVTIGGYVKLDTAFQDQLNNAGKDRMAPGPSGVVFDSGPNTDRAKSRNEQFLIESRESRFNLNVTDQIGNVGARAFIEVDFYGGSDSDSNSLVSNSNVVRLRHAWASGTMAAGGGNLTLLFGQTWSAFMNIDVASWDLIDFNGPAGQLIARQPQVRLTYGMPVGRDTLNLIGAVQAQSVNFNTTEDLASGLATTVDPARQEGQDVPAFVGKVQWLGSAFKAELGGIVSQAKGISPAGEDESEMVYGVQASVEIPFGPVSLALHGDRLHGINREANADYPDAVFRASDVAAINTTGGWGGVTYRLSPATKFGGYYGIRTADASGFSGFGRGASAFTDLVRQQTLHINALHRFWQRFQVGAEYERQWVEAFRQNSGDNNIYRVAFWFFF